MKLTYWVAECLDDARCYNVRAKTRKACQAAKDSRHDPQHYGPVTKVTVKYRDEFDLMDMCMDEDAGYWEV